MHRTLHPSWQEELSNEFEQAYFKELSSLLDEEYAKNECFPVKDDIFKAFLLSPFDKVKVVLLGQDPYHGAGQANGLSFSVGEAVKHPPSLVNIFKEIEEDLGKKPRVSGNLEDWAKQGVLLLNATLTVRAHQAGSHQNMGWEQFTDRVIETLSKKRSHLVFLLWGGAAQKKGKKIDTSKHLVLTSGHPSPLSANRGYWFGNKHFSAANEYLVAHDKTPIQW